MKCYHSEQEDMWGFGTCCSPDPRHQAGTKRSASPIASLASDVWMAALLSFSAGAEQLLGKVNTHLCQPQETALGQVSLK